MSHRIYVHIRSNLWGIVALWVALGGVAWASATIGASDIRDNAVRSNHIRNGEVQTGDLDGGAVTASKVAANSLGGGQIDETALDKSVVQSRISDGCAGGQAIVSVAQDGTPTCGAGGAGGATRINFSANNCTNASPCSSNIFSAGGWVINASCAANGLYGAITMTATSPSGGTVNYSWISQNGNDDAAPIHGGFPGSGTFTALSWGLYGTGAVGTIILNTPAQTISIPIHMYGVGQSNGYCEIYGTATAA